MENRFDKLLILRAFAATLVFLSHINIPKFDEVIIGFDPKWLLWFDGQSAVKIFFVLSGYLIGLGFWNNRYQLNFNGIRKFYISRIKRIAPLYYLVSTILVLFVYNEMFNQSGWLYKIIGIFTFTFDIDAMPYFNAAWWALSVEMQFYLIAPIVFWLLTKIMSKKVLYNIGLLIFVMVLGIVTRFVFAREIIVSPINQLRHFVINFDLFIVGMIFVPILYQIKKLNIHRKYINLSFFVISFGVYLLTSINLYTKNVLEYKQGLINHGVLLPTFMTIATLFIIYMNKLDYFRIKDFDNNRLKINKIHFLEIFGLISYGFYLIHGDIVRFFNFLIPSNESWINWVFVVFSSFVVTCILSFISYEFFEKRVIKN